MKDETTELAVLRTVIADTRRLTGLHITYTVEAATPPLYAVTLTVKGMIEPLGRMMLTPSFRELAVALHRRVMDAARDTVEVQPTERLMGRPGRLCWHVAADLAVIAFALDTLSYRYDT